MKSAKKHLLIGILMNSYTSDYYKKIYGASLNYLKFAQQFGTPVIIAPDANPEDYDLDLLILPGGPDLSLALQKPEKYEYGQGKDQPEYTYYYAHTIQKWVEAGVPMFGICLGMQALANHFDSTITKDGHGHQINGNMKVVRAKNTKVKVGANIINPNSRHHQFVTELGNELEVLCYGVAAGDEDILDTPKNGTRQKHAENILYNIGTKKEIVELTHIEAFVHKDLRIAGVQWHPEDLLYGIDEHGDWTTHMIIKWLLSAPTDKEVQQPQAAPQTAELSA